MDLPRGAGAELDLGPTPSRASQAVWTDRGAAWTICLHSGEGRGPQEQEPAWDLKARLGFHVAFMFYEGWEHAVCLLIIKAVFMTSPKENKKGKDPSTYSFRPWMKAWPFVPLGMAWFVALENKTRDACSGKWEALKLEAKQEQLSWMARPRWPDVTDPSTHHPFLPTGLLLVSRGHSTLINKGHIQQGQDSRASQWLSQRK